MYVALFPMKIITFIDGEEELSWKYWFAKKVRKTELLLIRGKESNDQRPRILRFLFYIYFSDHFNFITMEPINAKHHSSKKYPTKTK